jgi:hypothetical protein
MTGDSFSDFVLDMAVPMIMVVALNKSLKNSSLACGPGT